MGVIGERSNRTPMADFLSPLCEHHLTAIGPNRPQTASTLEEIIETGGRPA